MKAYLDNKYIKDYDLPHITSSEHFNDYLEGLKKAIVNDPSFAFHPEQYLILYDTADWHPIAYSIPSHSTYIDDWTIDETIIPPPIIRIYIYTNLDSIQVTNTGREVLLGLDLELTFLNELYVNNLPFTRPNGPFAPMEQNIIIIKLNDRQHTMQFPLRLIWNQEIGKLFKSLLPAR